MWQGSLRAIHTYFFIKEAQKAFKFTATVGVQKIYTIDDTVDERSVDDRPSFVDDYSDGHVYGSSITDDRNLVSAVIYDDNVGEFEVWSIVGSHPEDHKEAVDG
ncbi:hypothetical protein NDU88_004227 [Pleurodeles waltl]|uniref:Uncharacterized protein n=1 Tax=Pleurodeles waltl TaxID=8319 RepID=A0AAV7T866_PLEWA|nr:hypothetical protein NDU88_004227 [Pleurodeles waltl]